MGTKHICLPFPSEAQYRAYVDDPAQYRQYLTQMLRQYPERGGDVLGLLGQVTGHELRVDGGFTAW